MIERNSLLFNSSEYCTLNFQSRFSSIFSSSCFIMFSFFCFTKFDKLFFFLCYKRNSKYSFFTSFLIDTTNIIDFFDSCKFSDICLKLLTFISNSIFKPPWRLNGDGAIEGAQPSLASSTIVSAEPHTTTFGRVHVTPYPGLKVAASRIKAHLTLPLYTLGHPAQRC